MVSYLWRQHYVIRINRQPRGGGVKRKKFSGSTLLTSLYRRKAEGRTLTLHCSNEKSVLTLNTLDAWNDAIRRHHVPQDQGSVHTIRVQQGEET